MAIKVTRAQIWVVSIEDQPGGLAEKLSVLSKAGADLEFVFSRRAPDQAGTGVVFVTPLKGAKQVAAAKAAGFDMVASVHSVRVEAPDRSGLCAGVAEKVGAAGLNMRGFSAAALGRKAVMYLAFDNAADADKAVRVLKAKG